MGDIFLDCAQFLATKITAGVGQLVPSCCFSHRAPFP